MSSLLEISRIGLLPLIIVDVKSTRNIKNRFTPFDYIVDVKSTRNIENGFTPFDYCGCHACLPATSLMGLHPLNSLDVKSIRNIKNMLKKSVYS